ncbi:geranylgeranyl diphosphate synthase type I [Saccharothrix saharensis]|uniref:Geranylgeranyl diphosphate synthase type I n=1 Tax=Saccharothrix saharensis TaxID=571190 RepID=A0A543J908_9PSEU|nr:geranylgeranyl diphosphate synthase type I [Saccharothrix saharensis]
MVSPDAVDRARPVRDVVAWSRGLVEPALREAVDALPAPLRLVAGYHRGWWDERGHRTDAAGGKAIRPALALLAAEAVGGTAGAAVPAAAAVELVHDFTLLHDDVLDGDRTRRHRAAAWHVFGLDAAVLTGDALLAAAFDVLAASGHPAALTGVRVLNAAVRDLVEGEHADLAFERQPDVGVAECVAMVERKTGGLLAGACALGASFGGAEAVVVAGLRDFGLRLGVAYQHVDDLLGIWGEPGRTGKPVHADLRARKKSLPVVAALTSDTPAGRELAALYRKHPIPSDARRAADPAEPDRLDPAADAARAADLVERAGGRAWSERQAESLLAASLRHLGSVDPVPRAAAELTALAHAIVRRDH